MPVEEEDYPDAASFLAALRPGEPSWNYGGEGLSFPWVFRGHGNASWALMPSLFRRAAAARFAGLWTDSEDKVKRWNVMRGIAEGERRAASSLFCWRLVERELLGSFKRHCDLTGLALPDEPLEIEQKFSRLPDGPAGFSNVGKRLGDLANKLTVLAQHHGVPTRLLDFTRDARVAALFAARDCERERLAPPKIAVWAVRKEGNPSGRIVWLDPERHTDANIHAQSAVLAYDKEIERHYLRAGSWPDLEAPLIEAVGSGNVRKLTLPSAEVWPLLELLAREQLTWAHLMPGYDGCATAVMVKHEYMPTHCVSCTCSKITLPGSTAV